MPLSSLIAIPSGSLIRPSHGVTVHAPPKAGRVERTWPRAARAGALNTATETKERRQPKIKRYGRFVSLVVLIYFALPLWLGFFAFSMGPYLFVAVFSQASG